MHIQIECYPLIDARTKHTFRLKFKFSKLPRVTYVSKNSALPNYTAKEDKLEKFRSIHNSFYVLNTKMI